MTVSTTEAPTSDVYFDPYDVGINADPYPTFRRLREDLGINLPGVAAVMDLLERVEALQRELANLRRGSWGR